MESSNQINKNELNIKKCIDKLNECLSIYMEIQSLLIIAPADIFLSDNINIINDSQLIKDTIQNFGNKENMFVKLKLNFDLIFKDPSFFSYFENEDMMKLLNSNVL